MPEVLAIDWQRGRARCLTARVGRDRIEFHAAFETDWADEISDATDPQATADWLKSLCQTHAISPQRLLVVQPREAVVSRRLDLPDVPDEELADIVRLQAATRLSTPVDQLVFDYLPLPKLVEGPGRSVLLFTFDAARHKRLQKAAELAGLELGSIVTSATTIGETAVNADLEVRAKLHVPTLIVYQCHSRVELSIYFDQGRLIFSHAMQLPGGSDVGHVQPLKAEISRSLIALEQVHHSVQIERVLLIQEGRCDEHVLNVLNERFADRVQEISPSRDLSHLEGVSNLDSAALSATTVGAVLASAGPRLPGIDFLNPRKVEVKRDERIRRWGLVAAGVALVLATTGFLYYRALSTRDQRIAELQGQQAELTKLTDSEVAKAVFAEAGDIKEWQHGNVSPRATLTEFQELLNSTNRLLFTDLEFTSGTRGVAAHIKGNGLARDSRDIYDLERKLEEYGYRVHPNGPSGPDNRTTDPDYPYPFKLDIELLYREQQPVAEAG
jgi:hypothetical protein